MPDYNSLKVPELKKLLGERSLVQTGVKADLVARLQEHDEQQKKGGDAGTTEDVIDWDDEADSGAKKADAPAADAPKTEPSKPAPAAKKGEAAKAPDSKETPASEEKPAETAPASSFALGLEASQADIEAKKREARAKRFGITTEPKKAEDKAANDEDEAKNAARAKRFGGDAKTDEPVVPKGLDSALPERRPKRGRDRGDEGNKRDNKRATPDRRMGKGESGGRRNGNAAGKEGGVKPKTTGVLDDPAEKAKAEARAKRFGGS